MANWYGSSRSNYFKVKDRDAFETWARELNLEIWPLDDGTYAVAASDDGMWPTSQWSEEKEDYKDIEFYTELSKHLTDDTVAVLMTSGAEKLRYISGHAVAINHKGEEVHINLDDIYELAFKTFGVQPTPAEY